jgi:uncharacterized protein YprB with RNaseH-like and TPR domain/predicted nuclease with RNAse H fold
MPTEPSKYEYGSKMLRNTFIHIPGIGPKTEEALWKRGITTWQDFLALSDGPAYPEDRIGDAGPLSGNLRRRARDLLLKSEAALQDRDASFFAKHLPRSHLWRVFDEFRSSILFLDIETTGLSPTYHDITLVGCYDGRDYRAFIPGYNISQLQSFIGEASILVTFNGTMFDAPFLMHKIPGLKLPPVHLDLRFLFRRIGLAGGLKSIESALGLRRGAGGAADGREAVELWYRYLQGDEEAFRRLVRYNYDDTVGMEYLAEYVVDSLKSNVPPHISYNESYNEAGLPVDEPRILGGAAFDDSLDKAGARPGLEETLDRMLQGMASRPTQTKRASIRHLLSQASEGSGVPRIVGIDLTASKARPSGWAFLSGASSFTRRLRTDREIIHETLEVSPSIVCIDSPLSLPPGTLIGEDGGILSFQRIHRDSELVLRRRGVSLFWCLLPSMQKLTLRGMKIAEDMREHGLTVIESFPGAVQDILGMPRKGKSIPGLADALADFGIKGDFRTQPTSHDELDAITAAIVGLFYLSGNYEALGENELDDLILPRL